jgi:phosphate transport system protein
MGRQTAKDATGELRLTVLRMGALAEAILAKANRVVRERSYDLGREVDADDVEIDRLDVEVDSGVLGALAMGPLEGEDARMALAVKTMACDLERVGDLARNIASSGLRLAERTETELPARLEPLQDRAGRLLRTALDAFRSLDPALARQVLAADDEVDRLQDEMVYRLVHEIETRPEHGAQAVDVILIAESLERVADHATNIAEEVILIAEAVNVKHMNKLATLRQA